MDNDIIVLAIGVLVAFFVKGLCGFANTLVLGSVASYSVDNAVITPVDLLLTVPMNIILAVKNRKKIDKKVALMLGLFVIIGDIPGAIFLANADTDFLKILFGLVVVIISIEMYVRDKHNTLTKANPVLMVTLGLVSGLLCGLFGVGALLATYVGRTSKDTDSFKGTLCMVFLADNAVRLTLYFITGLYTSEVLLTCLGLFPLALLAMFIGMKFSSKIKESTVKKSIYIVLFLSGISLIVTNLILIL